MGKVDLRYCRFTPDRFSSPALKYVRWRCQATALRHRENLILIPRLVPEGHPSKVSFWEAPPRIIGGTAERLVRVVFYSESSGLRLLQCAPRYFFFSCSPSVCQNGTCCGYCRLIVATMYALQDKINQKNKKAKNQQKWKKSTVSNSPTLSSPTIRWLKKEKEIWR